MQLVQCFRNTLTSSWLVTEMSYGASHEPLLNHPMAICVLLCRNNPADLSYRSVVRSFFMCRALQLPPEAWLRMAVFNCSITHIVIG